MKLPVIIDEEGAHSPRGPSGASAWRRCHGKIAAEAGLPDRPKFEAAQGTIYHEYAANCSQFGLQPEDFALGKKWTQDGFEIEYDEDMVRYLRGALDRLEDYIEPGDIVLIEKRVDISPWAGPGEFGTMDVMIIKLAKREIIDWDHKYGRGVPVSPIKNDQCYLYTLGGWNDFAKAIFGGDPRNIKVTFHIDQPRAPGGGGVWETTMEEVLAEGELIREDALATRRPDAPRTPGEKQCMFCKASGKCPEQQQFLLDMLGQKYDDLEDRIDLGIPPSFADPSSLSMEVRSYILLHQKPIKLWLNRIHELTLIDLKEGTHVPLLKAVPGRAGRRFYRENTLGEAKKALAAKLGEKAFKPKELISPADAEKQIGRKEFAETIAKYVAQPPKKPILVPLEDARKPVTTYQEMYDALVREGDDDEQEQDDGED